MSHKLDMIELAAETLSHKAASSFIDMHPNDIPSEVEIALSDSYQNLFEGVSSMIENEQIKPFIDSCTLSKKQLNKLFTEFKKQYKTNETIRDLLSTLIKTG